MFEGRYQVSDHGSVRSMPIISKNSHGEYLTKSKTLRNQLSHKGYPVVTLGRGNDKKTKSVHRLVASSFVSNPRRLPEVNHIDGNKQNNHYSNLEWCTTRENCTHRHFDKPVTSRFPGVSQLPSGKWNAKIMIDGVRVHLGNFDSEQVASEAYRTALKNNAIRNKYAEV